ncbi:MAG TPA: thiamine pyrophosphate-dependent enzyme, partial [Vicinamibacterales bacterium]|nr:thiamine pyrophosphate-dependent enzyme [Vicinamibacterales bacterium]
HGAQTLAHQRLDHAALFASITNASVSLTAANVHAEMAAARLSARSPRPGPVHIACVGDVCSQNAGSKDPASEEPRSQHTLASNAGSKRSASEETGRQHTLSSEAGSLDPAHTSRRPLLLVGLGARRPEDAAAIRSLCERLRIPAMVTYKAKGVVPDDHPWFAGVFTNASIEQPLMNEADLLIGVGLDPVELLPRPWKHKQPIIYAGPWTVEHKHVPFAEQRVAPLPGCLASIERHLTTSSWDAGAVRAFVNVQLQAVSIATAGLSAQRVVELAAARFARTSRVTVDAGAHMLAATMLWPVTNPNDMLISNGLSTMGFALPAAIGAATADPARTVVALTGDGGLLMCVGELLTAVREKLRIITIVFSDASLSLIEIKQQARQLPAAGVDLGAIDWCALAASFGVKAFAAKNEESLAAALDSAGECEGPSMIEAKIDRSNYGATLRAIRG